MQMFGIGDYVKFSENVTQEDFDYIRLASSNKGETFRVAQVDVIPWEKYGYGGIVTDCGRFIPACLVVKTSTAQQKLDQLKKYFDSSNDVPVQQATIKAKDFWAIYNS